MPRLMMTVEQAFRIGAELWLNPNMVDLHTTRPLKEPINDWWPEYPRAPRPRPIEVHLVPPDGTTLTTACKLGDAHLNYGYDGSHRSDSPPGFKPPWVVTCALPGVEAHEVPPGTQVCLVRRGRRTGRPVAVTAPSRPDQWDLPVTPAP
jgi:hypothetical protein